MGDENEVTYLHNNSLVVIICVDATDMMMLATKVQCFIAYDGTYWWLVVIYAFILSLVMILQKIQNWNSKLYITEYKATNQPLLKFKYSMSFGS